MIEFNDEELNCEQENFHKASDGFIEDQHVLEYGKLSLILDERSTVDERSAIDATNKIPNNPQEIQINNSDTSSILDRSQIKENEIEKEREIIDTNL
ncbi:hypothetical protein GLOIN_2v1780048 [Rhizophagus clarus]|uniref:Uncharacterized protein n=1 Tax=Rhizophagus clarus TaxID=94130 RepID=A0A8H3QAE3_9GLOM|nr:hypothetical protein GLOIN_2v1780048 [Rhizophagus clarus]